MSKRGEAMAAADALLRALGKIEEVEATTATVNRDREAAQAALAETRTRLEAAQGEFVKADAEHQRWREATQRERTRVDAEIGQLQKRLTALQTEVTERRAESDNILAGIKALTARLKV